MMRSDARRVPSGQETWSGFETLSHGLHESAASLYGIVTAVFCW